MKSLYTLFSSLCLLILFILPLSQAEAREFEKGPVKVLEDVITEKTRDIFATPRNNATSKWCRDIGVDSRFTFTRTLCYIKNNSGGYLQYIMFIGFTVATILIIRNGFKLVTSTDREKQFTIFKKNMIYIVIGIVLLTGFYYFINIYIGIINLFTD